MHLWRPVGLKEMGLIVESQMKSFPPRLPEQPIFYPVLNRKYAEQIASGWNTKEPDAAGYVTRFELPDSLASRYERRVVGSSQHEEWWVPAAELPEFNKTIIAPILVETAFFGSNFQGVVPAEAGLKGKNARQQFQLLANHLSYSSFDVSCELSLNRKAVFLHFLFWHGLDPGEIDITEDQKTYLLHFIQHCWQLADIPFPLPECGN